LGEYNGISLSFPSGHPFENKETREGLTESIQTYELGFADKGEHSSICQTFLKLDGSHTFMTVISARLEFLRIHAENRKTVQEHISQQCTDRPA